MVRKREKQNEGVLLVLLRMRGGESGNCPGLATAAVRWRPSGARVCVAETGKLHGEQEVACGPPRRRAAPLSAGGRASRGAGRC